MSSPATSVFGFPLATAESVAAALLCESGGVDSTACAKLLGAAAEQLEHVGCYRNAFASDLKLAGWDMTAVSVNDVNDSIGKQAPQWTSCSRRGRERPKNT